jgi:hypothetical protein
MSDIRAESSFDVTSTPEEAWKALEELRARTSEPGEWWLPGFHSRAAEVDVEAPERLVVRKLEEPCADTLICITFEHLDTGTRIRVVQSGFDEAFVRRAGGAFWTHAEHIFADLHVFFAAGVIAGRAWRPWTPLGVGVAVEPLGLRVGRVGRGTWAERVGLRPDDLLLTVGGAPLYAAAELGVVECLVHAGDDVVATWARAGQVHEASTTV